MDLLFMISQVIISAILASIFCDNFTVFKNIFSSNSLEVSLTCSDFLLSLAGSLLSLHQHMYLYLSSLLSMKSCFLSSIYLNIHIPISFQAILYSCPMFLDFDALFLDKAASSVHSSCSIYTFFIFGT